MSENADAVQVGSEPAAAVVENVDAVQEPAAAARDVGGATTQADNPNLVRSVYLATCAHPQSLYAATGERLALPGRARSFRTPNEDHCNGDRKIALSYDSYELLIKESIIFEGCKNPVAIKCCPPSVLVAGVGFGIRDHGVLVEICTFLPLKVLLAVLAGVKLSIWGTCCRTSRSKSWQRHSSFPFKHLGAARAAWLSWLCFKKSTQAGRSTIMWQSSCPPRNVGKRGSETCFPCMV